MLALATTHDGDLPIFLRPLDGNSSDKEHLSAAVKEAMTQLREQMPEEQEQRIAVFDSGGYSEANMKSYNDATIWWISRVPETSSAAKTALAEVDEQWQALSDGSGEYVVRTMELPQGKERWVIVRTHAQVQATQEQMEHQVKKTHQEWEKRLWHLSKQAFACETDAQNAWEKALKGKPSWLIATFTLKEQGQYQQRGRPKQEATPDQMVWYVVPQLEVDQQEVTVLARKKAAFIVATNILDAQRLSHEQVISTYKEQGGVERGFRFLKDPLFLASSVFVKKPERVIALPLRDGALLVGVSPGRAPAASSISGNGPNHCQKGSTNRPTAPRCAGFSTVLRALISCTSAVVHTGKPRFWDCKRFISRFFACLVLHIHNSIFSLPKLRNVGYIQGLWYCSL